MSRLFCFALVVSLALPSFVRGQEDDKKPHPQESLETAIPHAIKLLEEKKYKEMIDSFAPPEKLTEMKARGTYETIITRFGDGEQAKQLIAALKEAQQLKPEFNEDKTQATFKSDTEGSLLNGRALSFIKIDNRWYGFK